jgi:WhiB family redox-sensing transcriptional regulator
MVLAALPWATDRPDVDSRRPSWQRQGLCHNYPEVSWFPELGERAEPAKAICRRCPVRNECLDYARTIGPSVEGIWAATSKRERRHLGKTVSVSGRGAAPTA